MPHCGIPQSAGTAAQEALARNARLFDSLADSYDAVGVDFISPIGRGLVEALAPQPGERVADLGCGKGAVLLPAASAVGPSGRAVGTDASPQMVRAARDAAARLGLDNVELLVDDAQSPSLAADEFDVVAASLVLFFLPDPGPALRAWSRLVVPHGRVGVSTFGPNDSTWRSVDDVFTPYLPPAMLDARTSGRSGPFASAEAMEQLFATAGLIDVRTIALDLAVRFTDAEHWRAFTMSTGQRAMWAAVPEAERPALFAEAVRRLAPARQPDGSYVLHQQVRYTVGRRAAA